MEWFTNESRSRLFPAGTFVRDSPLQISDTPRAGFEPAQNLSWYFVNWSLVVVITNAPWRRKNVLVCLCGIYLLKEFLQAQQSDKFTIPLNQHLINI